ncbi:MAG: RDD family protein [Kiritimatiellaeota bacterium]|nr:RDD family protein [Kiritimatiellota bacterium]
MWYYTEDGRQMGPVDEEAFADLVRRGAVTATTLVWRGGMAAWQPYGAVAGEGAGDGQSVMCAHCGGMFAPDDLADFSGTRVCAACKPLFVQQFKENAQAAGRLGMRYAGFWIRVGATMLDGIISSVLSYAVIIPMTLLGAAAGKGAAAAAGDVALVAATLTGLQLLTTLVSLCIGALYYIIPLVKWGATPGKMVCGLKVVRSDGSPLTVGRAIGRYFGNVLSGMICYIGYLMVAFDQQERKALHDTLCDTRVIHKNG